MGVKKMKTENIKTVEIRDRATLIPAFAIRMLPSDEYELFLFKDAGYRWVDPSIMLIAIESPWHSARSFDEWRNGGRSFPVAHKWIEDHFDEIKNGDVIDVEYILGEKENKSLNSFIEENLNHLAGIE
jgi:hypothetical protein